MLGTKKLHFDATVLRADDLQSISRCFPDVEDLVIEAQNAMALRFDVKCLKNLKFLELIVCPSDEYPGLISKELPECEEDNPYFDKFSSDEDAQSRRSDEEDEEFQLLLSADQKGDREEDQQPLHLILNLDQFVSHELTYLMENFGLQHPLTNLRFRVGRLIISQQQDDIDGTYNAKLIQWPSAYSLNQKTRDKHFSRTLEAMPISPGFQHYFFMKQRVMYRLVKFVKNKRFSQFPYEIVYERMMINKKVGAKGNTEEDGPEARRLQTFKVYAEEIEVRLRF